ncbi:MAG: hypothetical protein WCR42_07140 [bacterium]
MINFICLILISLSVYGNCTGDPYLRIQPAGDQDKYIPDIFLYNNENSVDTNYLDISDVPNEIQREIKRPKGTYSKLTKQTVYNIVIEKKHLLKLIEKLEKRIVTQDVIEKKGWLFCGTYKILYCNNLNYYKEGYFYDEDKLFFLKELKKIIRKRYKNNKPKLLEYNDKLEEVISGLDYKIKHRV